MRTNCTEIYSAVTEVDREVRRIKLFKDLADQSADASNPSVIGKLTYQVSYLERLPQWLLDLGLFLIGVGIALLLSAYSGNVTSSVDGWIFSRCYRSIDGLLSLFSITNFPVESLHLVIVVISS